MKPASKLTIHSFKAGMPPACCAPSVRPWKDLSKDTITFVERPPDFTQCVRHSLMAHSTASEPVVSRRTFFSGSGRMETSFSTRSEEHTSELQSRQYLV